MHSFKIQHVLLFFSSSLPNSNCYHEQLAQKSSIDTSPSSSSFLSPTPTRVETNPTRETKNVSFRGSGHSSAKGRPSWVDRPPRGGETSRRRPLRRHRPGYRCKILLSGGGEQRGGGGGEREREREISTYTRRRYLHLVIIQRASLRESHVEEGTCVGRSARGGRGREEAGEQCRGIETAREKATDVISSSWKSGLRLGGIRTRGHFCIEFSFVRGAKDEVEWKRRARNYSKFPSNGAKLATGRSSN